MPGALDPVKHGARLHGFLAFVRVTPSGEVRLLQGARDVAALLAFMEA